MRLSDLVSSLQSASQQWYDVLVTEFGGLQSFLLQYPHEFFFSRHYNALYVSLSSPQFVSRQPFQNPMPLYDKYSEGEGDHCSDARLFEQNRGHGRRHFGKSTHSGYYMKSEPVDVSLKPINDVQFEMNDIIDHIVSVLKEAPKQTLKAVELANEIRDNFGTVMTSFANHLQSSLTYIREHFSGLLNMLENYPDLFLVDFKCHDDQKVNRIPKNDFVTLVSEVPAKESASSHEVVTSPTPASTLDKLRDSAHSSEQGEPSGKRTVSRCLHVGNVGIKASEEDLRQEFGQFGEIEDIKIVHQGGEETLKL